MNTHIIRVATVVAVCGMGLAGCGGATTPAAHSSAEVTSAVSSSAPPPTSTPAPAPAPEDTPDGFAVATAKVPALCGQPAGQLVDGKLPTPPGDTTTVAISVLADGHLAVATGDIDGSGQQSTAIAYTCTVGGTPRPPIVVLYDAHGTPVATTGAVTPAVDPTMPLKSLGIGANVVRYEAGWAGPDGTTTYHPVSVTYSGGAFTIADVQ